MFKITQKLMKDPNIAETKAKIVKAFEELGVIAPETMQEQKELPKADKKLIHVGVQHLYTGALQNLQASEEHLQKLIKKGDKRAEELLPAVEATSKAVTSIINLLAQKVEEMPSIEEISHMFGQLQKEFENAQLLKLMDTDVPKEKMHYESNSS